MFRHSLPNSVLPFLWHFMRSKRLSLLIIMCCPFVWATVTTVNPYMLKVIIDTVITFPGDPAAVWSVAWKPVALFVGLGVFLEAVMRLENYVTLRTIPLIKADIRATMFDYVQQHSHAYFQDRLAGTLSNKVLDMVRGFENMFTTVVTVFFPIILNCILSAFLLLQVHWLFSLFVVVWFSSYMSVTAWLSIKCIKLSDHHSESNSTLSGRIVDAFRNIAVVRSFARRSHENSDLDKYQNTEVKLAQKLAFKTMNINTFQGIASIALLSSALVLFIFMWQKDLVTVGDFTFVTTITFSLMVMAWWMADQFVTFFKELGVSRQALSVINIPHGVVDKPDAAEIEVDGGRIEFKNVLFQYVPGKNIFDGKNLVIEAGERVGLVGFSGSGKTTFINLILRYFDLQGGVITVDGQDISQVKQESLRDKIALIPQDASLFHRSLADNIRYSHPEASDQEVIEASKKACCHEFIMELEEGYDSLVGEGGVKLSGGQRQRVAIARAILKDSPILILDEATSALDSATERKIQKSLEVAMENRTTIVIAHRLSTLSMLDRILVFHEGKIIESGTHAQLLKQDGHYAYLWKMQTDGFLPE